MYSRQIVGVWVGKNCFAMPDFTLERCCPLRIRWGGFGGYTTAAGEGLVVVAYGMVCDGGNHVGERPQLFEIGSLKTKVVSSIF